MITNDDFTVAVHEAGHSVVASHFRIPSYPELTPHGFSRVMQTESPAHAGLCHYDTGPITRFQHAVISWSGMMSECLYGKPPFWVPPFRPSKHLLRDWHGMMMQQMARLSDGDRRGIIGYADSWRSCKSAFTIVRKNQARIVRLAKVLSVGRVEESVAWPKRFPATFSDFLVQIVDADGVADSEAKFLAFIRNGIEDFFAGKNLHLDPVQHQQAVKCWTTTRMDQFKKGFANSDVWRSVALAYKTWVKTTIIKL